MQKKVETPVEKFINEYEGELTVGFGEIKCGSKIIATIVDGIVMLVDLE